MTAWLDAPLQTLSIHDLDLPRHPGAGPMCARLRPAVFLDKDGTLTVPDDSAVADPSRLRLMPGAGEALARLSGAGLALVLVTNESGISRGAFTRAQFARLQGELLRRLKDDFGVHIDDVAVCPHGPDAQGKPACLCRKPAPGMLTRAARAHGLDLTRSWMVGDLLDDVEAGHRAGAMGLLLDTGGENAWRRSPLREPDGIFNDWPSLTDHLLQAFSAMNAAMDAAASPGDVTPASGGPALPPASVAPAQAPV